MKLRLPVALLKWVVALAVLGSLVALAYTANALSHREREEESSGEQGQAGKRPNGNVVQVDAEAAESQGVRDQPAVVVSWVPRVPAYGRVVPNPRATAEVRSAFAGTLRADPGAPWPAPGQWVRSGQLLGRVDVRIGPQERLDLQSRLNEARLKQQGAEEILRVQQERADRLQKASTAEIVSRRELDEALVALSEARTQLAASRAAVELWQKALGVMERRDADSTSLWSEPLTAPAEGEVTELAGRPGENVEAGGLVARLVDFRRTLVRLDIPPEGLPAGPPRRVELFPASPATPGGSGIGQAPAAADSHPLAATLVGAAPEVDVASQFLGYWYEADANPAARSAGEKAAAGRTWRPGLFVAASVETAAEPRKAVAVPATALLYYQGQAVVFVRTGPGRYERRAVEPLGREGERWVLAAGVAAGEPVVYQEAQVLLGQQLRGEPEDND